MERPSPCPRCGAGYEPSQEYCIECGLRLPVTRGIGDTVGRAWRLQISRYPSGWLWVVLVLLAVTAVATVVAVIASDTGEPAVRTIVATEEPLATAEATPTATAFVPTTAPTRPATTAPGRTTTAAKQRAPIGWPLGRSAYTVVVASVPTTTGRDAARRHARAAIGAGLPRVGVLDSSKFASLRPGYYVVFSGLYETEDEALAAVDAAQDNGYPRAYEREITP